MSLTFLFVATTDDYTLPEELSEAGDVFVLAEHVETPVGQCLGAVPDGNWWQWLPDILQQMPEQVLQQPLLILDAGIQRPQGMLDRLKHAAQALPVEDAALSPLHPRHPAFSVLTEHSGWQKADAFQRDAACFLLGEGRLLPQAWLNPQAVWLTPACLQKRNFHPRALAARNACWLQADLLLGEETRARNPVVKQQHKRAEGVAEDIPAALLQMAEQISQWQHLPEPCWPGLQPEPVLLHITHDWGGGTEQWLKDYCAHEQRAIHLVLRSHGDWKSRQYGRRLSIQLGPDGPVLQQWDMQPVIDSTVPAHSGWQAVVEALCQRFSVHHLIVSSLIGHSLQALEQPGLKTLWLMHDYFPLCPALNLFYRQVCQQCDGTRLQDCLQNNPLNQLMQPASADHWLMLRESLAEILHGDALQQVAPTRQVLEQSRQVLPACVREDAAVVAHGLNEVLMQAKPLPLPQDWQQAEKLRLVLPGQLSSAKGLDLLLQAWPRLQEICELTLLGCGKAGRVFWGQPGVHVIHRYRREELPEHLKRIQPHLALFLSTVPETFGLALVEHMHLGVVPVATRLGAFVEHVRSGENGLLIEADADALVEQIYALHVQRDSLPKMHQQLQSFQARSLQEMVADYRKLLHLRRQKKRPRYTVRPFSDADALILQQFMLRDMRARGQLQQLRGTVEKQQHDLDSRARWARKLERQLNERTEWAKSMHSDLQKKEYELRGLRQAIEDMMQYKQALQQEQEKVRQEQEKLQHERQKTRQLEQDQALLQQQLQHVESERQALLNSTSWKVTRPLRWLASRARSGRHRMAFYLQRLRALWQGLLRNLRTRGLRGTARRVVERLRSTPVQAEPAAVVAAPELNAEMNRENLPVLPTCKRPEVSVVIPVFNQLHYTLACLQSLVDTVSDQAVEVIVVDDCSTADETAEVLPKVQGLRYVRNETNLGFVGSCNRGAQEARGDYLFFLNNDTQLQPGWLEPLLQQFQRRPQTGLVGSQLVYPDGRLQESGGVVFSDASGWNVGRFEHPDDPRYRYARQVDYCSGAAIMIPRELFHELGGFDGCYAPAYYEDTDLAFKVREAGREVWVQPASRVVHFEGITCGTDTASGVKKHQLINQKTFQERWAEALKRQPAPGSDIQRAKEHGVRGRVLIIDACTPTPDQDSGSVRMQNLFMLFQQLGWKVSFLPENHAELQPYTARFQAMGVEMLHTPWFNGPRWFEERGAEFDLVILSRHYVASQYLGLVRAWMPQARVWFDTVDLHYLREQRQAELENSDSLRQQAARTREQELSVARGCDLTLVVSPVEKDELAQTAPEVEVAVLSNIHTLPVDTGPGYQKRKDLVFVGGYQHPPNVDAAQWFVEEIFPRIRAELPEVQFHLVGSKAPESVRQLGEREGVVFHGFVEDIEPFMRDIRVAVAPLRYGAGVKGKVNMSMAHGQPVVGTSVAFEGMHAEHGTHGLLAETAEDFAREVVRLYQDAGLWQKLSAGGRENVQRHFSMDAARERLQSLLPQETPSER